MTLIVIMTRMVIMTLIVIMTRMVIMTLLSSNSAGGFTWSLHFTWVPLTDEDNAKRSQPSDPIPTPMIAGGLFAVDKSWFFKLVQWTII